VNAPLDAGLAAALAALGLRPDADARAVRRAYALQLKQIDQATELRAFQSLREAYEYALAGIARRDAQAQAQSQEAPAPAAPPESEAQPAPSEPQPATEPAMPESARLAQAVFQGFIARAEAGFKDEPDAADALSVALGDDRLLNLEARTIFEWQVANLIMSGWRPGHEFLFSPACEAFDWEQDRGHLRIFGQLGAALDAAINEKLIFFRQDPDLQLDVLRRLRGPEMPSLTQRRTDFVLVQAMVRRYPNWLRLVTSQSNINTWFQDLPEPAPAAPATTAPPPQAERPKRMLPWLGWIFALLVVIGGLNRTVQHQPPPGASSTPPWARVTPTTQPAANPWPDSVLAPANDPLSGSGTTAPAPLYRDLPPPAQEPPPQPVPAGAQFAFLGNVTFIRNGDQITVDEVDTDSTRGRSTLRPGDRVQGCPPIDKRIPFVLVLERSGCDNVKNVDEKTGIVTYVFHVLRRGQSTTAALVMPPPQGQARTAANAAAVEEALKAAATLPMPPPPAPAPTARPSTEATVQLGHVTFGRQDSAVVVARVGERTDHSFGTLQPGDMVLGCMAGSYHLPLIHPSEVRHCVVSNPPPQDALTRPYMFRILRNGQSQPASLTLRDGPAAPASSPAPASALQFGSPG